MGRRGYRLALAFGLLMTATLLAGCASLAPNRTPEEWLKLSIAGLTATDNFIYKGQTTVSTADGWSYAPSSFEGKIVGHEQLKAQFSDDSFDWSPVKQLEDFQNGKKHIQFANDIGNSDADAKTPGVQIMLHILEDGTEAKERWSRRLKEELEALKTDAPAGDTAIRKEWLQQLEHSQKQLKRWLDTLQVSSNYDLIIDQSKLIPLSMKEHTVFTYRNGQKERKESRNTIVEFSSFDGSASMSDVR
ncbi:hypothetical protein [Paenibacillus sp. NEAU-GSW1]|uniref:hypothetical protein n=1 Tax=Paenibacillus sp. NEAU-GSW1 TaxID=2682486 RepID=UPI0012E3042A|nr:hypothetical protein [Paenibacillus sp. NEAU-GSW1]MUT66785.1 hypothetical protein [Paenibacillus sp. NEAU-GSW1]